MNKKLIISVIILVVAFFSGYKWAQNSHLKAQLKLKDQLREKQAEYDAKAVQLEKSLNDIKIEYIEIDKEVIKYVETTPTIECFDDDAIRLYNATSGR